jgi:hypothetical protein
MKGKDKWVLHKAVLRFPANRVDSSKEADHVDIGPCRVNGNTTKRRNFHQSWSGR